MLQKKLQAYEEREFNDQILAGDAAFNEACMQIDLSPPINSNVSTSTSATTKPTSTNNTYITPQHHNSHRPTPQQLHHSPTFGILPTHQNQMRQHTTTSYLSNYHPNFNPRHHTVSTSNNEKNDFPRPRPVNPYQRKFLHSTGG